VPITALQTPVQLAPGVIDPHGELFVPNAQLGEELSNPSARVPLVLRTHAQRDCIDVTLVSQLVDDAETHGLSKADLHIHFLQFDVQGSDGVVAGFNSEQSVRPWKTSDVPLASPAPVGATSLHLQGIPLCRAGETLALGPGRAQGPEIVQVTAVHGSTVQLRDPLTTGHPAAEPTTTEFVRYRWYPDAQTGTAYFHDHIDAISSWRHGLFGALIIEPPDATWTDPATGAPVPTGALADISTSGSVGLDEKGSFREFVALLQDDVQVHQTGHSTGGALGMRASPPLGQPGPPAAVVKAYVGDPVVFRTLVPSTNDVHTFAVEGHAFRVEPWSPTSPLVGALHVGISERFDVVIPAAGGSGRRAGDFVFGDGRTSKLREGVWGVLRVLPHLSAGLRPLPGKPALVAQSGPVCPPSAPVRRIDVTAADLKLPMLEGESGSAFIPTARLSTVLADPALAEPLTLHVSSGDCLQVTLRNNTAAAVSLGASVLASDPGARPVLPGGTGTFTFWASASVGGTVGVLRDLASPLDGPDRGLYGAVVVAPAGSSFRDPSSGDSLPDGAAGAQVVVRPARGRAYRDFSLYLQDSDGDLGTHQMPYRHSVIGTEAISYAVAPNTPVLLARVGDPLRLHVIGAVSEQEQSFELDGHRWPLEPGAAGSSVVAAQAVGAREVLTIEPLGGAGGEGGRPGDYVYGDARGPYRSAGLWGVLRVLPSNGPGVAPLSASGRRGGLVLVLAVVLGAYLVMRSRRSLNRVAADTENDTYAG
jgi:hypothetical protein